MKYFILKPDERYKNTPMIKGISQEIIDPRDLYQKNYNLMPKATRLEIYNQEEVDFIDIIINPLLIMTEKSIEVVKMYMPKLSTRDITFVDEIGGRTELYKLPLIPKIYCLTGNSRLNESKSYIEYGELDMKKVRHNTLFYIGESTSNYVVIRLDMLESMLKRGAKGFVVEEIKINC